MWVRELCHAGAAADRPEDLAVPVGLDDEPERRVGDQQVAVREQADVVWVVERLSAVELQAVELAQHLARGSDLDYPPVPAVGDEEGAGGEHPRASRPEELCGPLQRPRLERAVLHDDDSIVRRIRDQQPAVLERLDGPRKRKPPALGRWLAVLDGDLAADRRTRRRGGCPHRRRAGCRPAARRQTSARRGPPPAAAEPRPSPSVATFRTRSLRVSAISHVPSGASQAARGLERRLPRLPGSRQRPTCWTTEPSRASSTTTWQNSSAIEEVPVAEELDAARVAEAVEVRQIPEEAPARVDLDHVDAEGSSANATRNVPCGVGEAVSGIRLDSGERSSVETRSPAGDSSTICHWVTRRIASDSPARKPYASSSPHSAESASSDAVRVEPQRPVPGPQGERFLDRELVDDDRRAVCGARREHRVAQPRGRRADAPCRPLRPGHT